MARNVKWRSNGINDNINKIMKYQRISEMALIKRENNGGINGVIMNLSSGINNGKYINNGVMAKIMAMKWRRSVMSAKMSMAWRHRLAAIMA
jgi:hypothetical protein